MPHQQNILLNLVTPAHMEPNDRLRCLCKLLQALVNDVPHPGLEDPGLQTNQHQFSQPKHHRASHSGHIAGVSTSQCAFQSPYACSLRDVLSRTGGSCQSSQVLKTTQQALPQASGP